MKKVLISMALLLAVLSGCQNAGKDLEKLIDSQKYTIFVSLDEDAAKTTLDAGGFITRWDNGDQIGVYSGNTGTQGLFTLVGESAGSTDGIFKGSLSGAPQYAYFPYTSGAGNNAKAVALNLPETQTQPVGGQPDMTLDVKSGVVISGGSAASGYQFNFSQRLVLLHFVFTPNAALSGDVLSSISMEVSGKVLAGDYTLDVTNGAAVPAFASGGASKVTLEFASPVTLSSGTPVEAWMFVAPAVASGDAITIKAITDNHQVLVNVNASKAYSTGYRYNMPIDVAALIAAGKADVVEAAPSSWYEDVTEWGVYDISGSTPAAIHTYVEFQDQYMVQSTSSSFTFGIQSVLRGYVSDITLATAIIPKVGGSVNVTYYHVDESGASTTEHNCTIVKADGNRLWIEDATDKLGFVINKIAE